MTRTLLVLLLCALHLAPAMAQNTSSCPISPQTVTVYFSNSILTSPKAAKRALTALSDAMGGARYDNKTLHYELSYNASDEAAVDDALQAAQQAGSGWNSDLIKWFSTPEQGPDWFQAWYRARMIQGVQNFQPNVEQHLQAYRSALNAGNKVMLVGHGLGNMQNAEAYSRLKSELSSQQLENASVFGVSVPSNQKSWVYSGNVRRTMNNHRDFVAKIPTNGGDIIGLTLVTGDPVGDEVNSVQAHSFVGTYLSDRYNVKSALVARLLDTLDTFRTLPSSACVDAGKSYLTGLFAGTYNCYDDVPEKIAGTGRISPNGLIGISAKSNATFNVADPSVYAHFYFSRADVGTVSLVAAEQNLDKSLSRYLQFYFFEFNKFNSVGVLADSAKNQNAGECSNSQNPSVRQSASNPIPNIGNIIKGAVEVTTGSGTHQFREGQCTSPNASAYWFGNQKSMTIEFDVGGGACKSKTDSVVGIVE